MARKGLKRYWVTCAKCHYEWASYTPEPKRCALCNNPNINQPKIRKHRCEIHLEAVQNADK